MKKSTKIISSTLLGAAGLGAAAGNLVFYLLSNTHAKLDFLFPKDEMTDDELEIERRRKADYGWFDDFNKEEYYMTSRDGLQLHGMFFPAEDEDAPYVLAIHGFHSTGRREYASIARFYYEMGLNVFVIDQRGHGGSEGKYLTYGALESLDCLDWIEFMKDQFGQNIEIILHGVSMGGATTLMMCDENLSPNVKCAVSDCAYSSLEMQLKHNFVRFNLPKDLMYKLYRSVALVKGHFDPDKVNPIIPISTCKIPILFIHGAQDDFVPFHMVYALYDSCLNEHKRLLPVEGAGHSAAFFTDDRARDEIRDFIHCELNV